MSTSSLSTLPSTPSELKSINPYLQRAKEMEKVDPVITYWCCFHAAQTCMSIRPTEKESRTFLMSLLDHLEQTKATLADHDAITDNLAAAAYVENFGLKIFGNADDEDREGRSNKFTAQRFIAAACFLEVLQSLTTQPEADILQKIKYAKWKAASILKALRDDTTSLQTSQHYPTTHTSDQTANHSDPFSPSSSSAHVSNQASNDWPTAELAPNSTSRLPSPVSVPSPSTPLNVTHSASSANPFPSTVFPPGYDSRHNLPSVPLAGHPIPSVPDLEPSRMVIEPVIGVAPKQFPALPPTTTHHLISNMPLDARPSPPPLPSPPSSVPTQASAQSGKMIDPLKISEIQKHAKWAVSALNYEDLATARKELLIALEQLDALR